jgi:hypothetical protein
LFDGKTTNAADVPRTGLGKDGESYSEATRMGFCAEEQQIFPLLRTGLLGSYVSVYLGWVDEMFGISFKHDQILAYLSRMDEATEANKAAGKENLHFCFLLFTSFVYFF